MKCAASTLFSLSLMASVAAHGWVGTLTVAGKAYKGNQSLEQVAHGAPSVVRQVANNLPIKDLSSRDLACGRTAKPAVLVATAVPGDTLLVDWDTLTGDGNCFHEMGPMTAYLTSCGAKSCADFDAAEARWFKIMEQGMDAKGNLAQARLTNGSPARVTLPANLKTGNYLLQHEIIALHTAQSPGGAELYPSCSQLRVTGSGTGSPQESELVRFLGAYHAKDKGILIDIYNMKGAYQFPGPPVAAFVKGGASPLPSHHSSLSAHTNATHTSAHIMTHAASHSTAK
ncbi:hypothetical protein MVEN_00853300 [Mycena venus]|uniref:lytic cellulose monooxygenase (C4-dehydrogenating) n=1 Tax=Mycena venus TaxID=2733690 RepID=A0A8H6YE51_9AGAR|nr:hypothetical protein MVEN_00853300 [Mycena venus]